MIVFVLVAMALAFAFVPASLFSVRRQRTPPELRGDWWPKFEAEFRAYASRLAGQPEPGRRRHDQPPR
jgi:hypothetical protein